MNRNTLRSAVLALAAIVAIAAIGMLAEFALGSVFAQALRSLRDPLPIAYMFLVRIGLPLVVVVAFGTWLEQKLNP